MTNPVDKNFSFGKVCSANGQEAEFKKISNCKLAAKVISGVAIGILFGTGATTAVMVFFVPSAVILALAVGVAITATLITTAIILQIISMAKLHAHICRYSGIIFSKNGLSLNPSEEGICSALPTTDSKDTENWRIRLLEAAQHNVLLSGNYCGGKSFSRFLAKVKEELEKPEKKDLKVSIIGSPAFFDNDNRKTLKELKEMYPGRFSFVESPVIWHTSNGTKHSTNHTKCMAIDFGKYYILGGSGITDDWSCTGLDKGDKKEGPVQKKGYFHGLMPEGFRDMDFVFRADEKLPYVGNDIYRQMLLLTHRWEQYHINKANGGIHAQLLKEEDLGIISGEQRPISEGDSVTTQLLKSPIPEWDAVATAVEAFDSSAKKADDVAFRVLASSPEQKESVFASELIKHINGAKKRVVVNHMYFHPTKMVMEALVEAANRGVKVTIITAGVFNNVEGRKDWCPATHKVFGPRNKYNYTRLYNNVELANRKNIEVYEFEQQRKGLHKKVIIVDDHVLAGSSNLGYKSLMTTSDNELNFITSSAEFANATMEVCAEDIRHSIKIERIGPLSAMTKLAAAFHSSFSNLIG